MFVVHVSEPECTSTSDPHPPDVALQLAKAWEENGSTAVTVRTPDGSVEWTIAEFEAGRLGLP